MQSPSPAHGIQFEDFIISSHVKSPLTKINNPHLKLVFTGMEFIKLLVRDSGRNLTNFASATATKSNKLPRPRQRTEFIKLPVRDSGRNLKNFASARN